MASDEILELSIDTLVHGGRGLGRHEGMAVFVPLAAPGDRVRCKVTRRRKHYLEASLEEILEPSALRREPPCPLFGDCGGCQWQHLDYAHQAEWKERLFREQLTRNKLVAAEQVKPIVAAPREWSYRNRIQLKCRMTDQGFLIGFYRPGSHFIVDVPSCLLVEPAIQATLEQLRADMPKSPAPEAVPQIDISCSDDGSVQLVVHLLPVHSERMLGWLTAWATEQKLNVTLQVGRKQKLRPLHGETRQKIQVDEPALTLEVSPGGFSQINTLQNRSLVAEVVRLAALKGQERVLDLFCGVGNFSLPLARRAAELVGVEAYAPAIADAARNAAANRIQNATFRVGDAAEALRSYAASGHFDLLVVDPPRTGCSDVAKALENCQPERIIYVSCDPATLARDLALIFEAGYALISSQPFDLFPQTWHTESVTLLARRN